MATAKKPPADKPEDAEAKPEVAVGEADRVYVKATELGYYGDTLRPEGAEFWCEASAVSEEWMEPCEPSAEE